MKLTKMETKFNISEEEWSGVGLIRNNSSYGNYVVSSRVIEEGELLIEEYPVMSTPYGTSDCLPFCLSCGKQCTLTKCSTCNWPLCNNDKCKNDSNHLDWECPIFASANYVQLSIGILDYSAIEVLRCLLLRSKNPEKWARILQFESHAEDRRLIPSANEVTEFILNFIREKCQLIQYDSSIVERVSGICAVNAFWGFKDLDRPNASLLFDKVTLLSHDCDSNAKPQIIEKEDLVDGVAKILPCIQIKASRKIKPNEPITIYYINCSDGVSKRQRTLREAFHFDCKCDRCLRELMEKPLFN